MTVLTTRQLPQFEIIGPPAAPAVAVLGGISAHRHVTSSVVDPRAGWWEAVVGPGRAIDTGRFRVVGVDFLDGGRASDGRPAHTVTTGDQADALAAVLDAQDVASLHAIVGASYGGMVALAFAERYPDRVGRLVAIGAADAPHPMTTALRAVQRGIVELGLAGGQPREGLVLARALAMTTYRSRREFADRFPAAPDYVEGGGAAFPVEGYLRHHGERFADSWTAARFLALSLSADLHHVDPAAIRVPTLLVAAEGDSVVPREQLEQLVGRLGGPARLADVHTITGHDAFLTEPAQVGALVQTALTCPEFP